MPELPSSIPQPVAAVIAVVGFDQKFLLVRRANPPDAGYWGFPGGKIHFGETLTAAATRELREETGVIAEAEGVLTTLDAFDRVESRLRAHYLLVAVACRYVSGEPIASDDALEARWFTEAEISSTAFQLSRDVGNVARLALRKIADGRPK